MRQTNKQTKKGRANLLLLLLFLIADLGAGGKVEMGEYVFATSPVMILLRGKKKKKKRTGFSILA